MIKQCALLFVSLSVLFTISCSINDKIDTSSIEIKLDIIRFDKIMMDSSRTSDFRDNNRDFFKLFIEDVMNFGSIKAPDQSYIKALSYYRKEPSIIALQKEINTKFADLTPLNKTLTNAFIHYKYYFPKKGIPTIYTLSSSYKYAAFTGKNMLCIGLDMFLGKDYPIYNQIGLPNYIIHSLNQEYLPAYVMKAQIQGEFESANLITLIDHMIYNGKIMYCLERLLPTHPKQTIISYTKEQINWVEENEREIWQFFLDQELLYNSQNSRFFSYISEGPTTNGMPIESPGNIGTWLGWQIVHKFMEDYPEISLQELMENHKLNGKYILSKSNYKPR